MPSRVQSLFMKNQPGIDDTFLNLVLYNVRGVNNDYKKVANQGKKIDVLNANIRSLDYHFEDLQAYRKGMAFSRDCGTDQTFGRYFLQVREEIFLKMYTLNGY